MYSTVAYIEFHHTGVLDILGYTSKVSTFLTSISQTVLLLQTDIYLCMRV